jgi:LmbE family N-acetylglucosaminyl deacetylase
MSETTALLRFLKGTLAARPVKTGGKIVQAAGGLTDRRFSSRLAYEPEGPVLLLSPHHDDAVLNCWSVLDTNPQVRVVNVFAGIPRSGLLTEWDRVCGARDSADHMRLRITEDRRALALVGQVPHNLPFLDLSYRRYSPRPSLAAIDAAVSDAVPGCSRVVAPVAAEHQAHDIIRRYAVAVALSGIPGELYAEIPYMTRMGWPDWVTGKPRDPHLDVRAFWAWNRAIPGRRSARVVSLDENRSAAKLAAIRTYRSQLAAIDGGPLQVVTNPAVHGYEVFWPIERRTPSR